MLISLWSVKGGAGTTVVSVSLSLVIDRSRKGALVVDLGGDVPAALGLPDPGDPGISGWLSAGSDVPGDDRLVEVEEDGDHPGPP